uniref:ATP-citrate synthase alpha chain protein 2 n=1 Tax=Rhizophora mucronata TaxID=61149 RepID=A0A2P2JZ47_RHIMU
MKLSVELRTLPKGSGNSIIPHFLKFLKAAVSSNSPLISSGYGSPFTRVNGFISRKLKSRSMKNIKPVGSEDHRDEENLP